MWLVRTVAIAALGSLVFQALDVFEHGTREPGVDIG
jgi:hypothetical protein